MSPFIRRFVEGAHRNCTPCQLLLPQSHMNWVGDQENTLQNNETPCYSPQNVRNWNVTYFIIISWATEYHLIISCGFRFFMRHLIGNIADILRFTHRLYWLTRSPSSFSGPNAPRTHPGITGAFFIYSIVIHTEVTRVGFRWPKNCAFKCQLHKGVFQ